MRLRGQTVLVRCDESGRPQAVGERVEIRYRPNDGRAYRAHVARLEPIPGASIVDDAHCGPAEAVPGHKGKSAPDATHAPVSAESRRRAMLRKAEARAGLRAPPEGTVVVYADGACSGNPGPAGIGIRVEDGAASRELSEYLGPATNNIAELTAILRAAELFGNDERPIEIRTDSQYAIGVLTKGWKAKANTELVAQVKRALARLGDRVRLVYVPGHAAVAGNERADSLARAAIVARKSSGWVRVGESG